MWIAFLLTLIAFGIVYSAMLVLKRSANKFKIPPNIKPQPYDEDDD